MFIFILQLRQLFDGHTELYMFAVYSALIWFLWLIKMILSSRYRPYVPEFKTTTSVVVPVVDEPIELFRDVIGRMVEQKPDEIIVVINGAENPNLVAVCEEFAPLVQWTHTPIPGKRNAVMIGTQMSTGDITVLVDSDTVWMPDALTELVKPFADDRVGGVTTRQRILDPKRSWITRWADWLENSRALYSMPAQSVLGQIGCLPGRTIAFRRFILMRVMDKFMSERFLGVFLEVSDDRTLTNLTLKEGFRTVYQYTSLVYTDAPLKIKKLYKQQLRWARGSQYNTLRMLPWMLSHAPMLAFFFIMDILLPFMLAGVVGGWIFHAFAHEGYNFYSGFMSEYGLKGGVLVVAALMVTSSVISMSIRQVRHLSEKPTDFFRLPIFIIVSTFFLMPIRLIGFFRMAHVAGWGTRDGAYAGGEDDPEPTPSHHASLESSTSPDGGTLRQGAHALAGTDTLIREPDETSFNELFAPLATLELRDRNARASTLPARKPRRRLNYYAAIPYVIGIAILTVEAFFVV